MYFWTELLCQCKQQHHNRGIKGLDIQIRDRIADSARKIESLAEIMELCFDHMTEYPGAASFQYCLEEIRTEAEGIRTMIRKAGESDTGREESSA